MSSLTLSLQKGLAFWGPPGPYEMGSPGVLLSSIPPWLDTSLVVDTDELCDMGSWAHNPQNSKCKSHTCSFPLRTKRAVYSMPTVKRLNFLCNCRCKSYASDLCNCWCKCHTSLCNCWCKCYTSDLCNCWCKRYTFDLCICRYAGNIGISTV